MNKCVNLVFVFYGLNNFIFYLDLNSFVFIDRCCWNLWFRSIVGLLGEVGFVCFFYVLDMRF